MKWIHVIGQLQPFASHSERERDNVAGRADEEGSKRGGRGGAGAGESFPCAARARQTRENQIRFFPFLSSFGNIGFIQPRPRRLATWEGEPNRMADET